MLYLASASPRRAALLQQIGVPFRVAPVDIDESWLRGETLENYVGRLAAAKARQGADALPPGSTVLAADTAGECAGEPLLKPRCEADALRMLRRMSGTSHTVSTAISICCGERQQTRVVNSTVWFRPLDDAECSRYWATGEPQDKAGSYAIQGLGAVFVERIDGSYSGVVGLPLLETAQLLHTFGIPCWQTDQTATQSSKPRTT